MPTTLVAGDIAFTAFQADNAGGAGGDGFEFVLLKAISLGTTIFFTDNGYRPSTNDFTTSENLIRYVAQGDLPAGTKVRFVVPGGTTTPNTAEFTQIVETTGDASPNAEFGLSTSGDSITALVNFASGATGFTGTAIAQIFFGGTAFNSNTTNSNQTALAAGLTVGVNAVAVGNFDNGVYNPDATGTSVESGSPAQLRAALFNAANFTVNEEPIGTGFTTANFASYDNYIEGNTNAGQTLIGTAGADYIIAKAGNDIVDALGGDDRVLGNEGNDTISLGAGQDIAYGDAGIDTIDYSGSAGAIFADLVFNRVYETNFTTAGATVSASDILVTDLVYGFENLNGSAFGDRLQANALDNVIAPGAGRDIVYGLEGNDTVSYFNSTGAVFVDLAAFTVYETATTTGTITSGDGATSIDYVYGIESATGSAFGDRLYGTDGFNVLQGLDGDDVIYGLGGGDVLNGGTGNDTLVGNAGADVLTGGTGLDRFYYVNAAEGGDTITDFNSTDDDLYFSSANFGSNTLVASGSGSVAGPAFFYNSVNGQLSYSATGSEAAGTLIATLGAGVALSQADIVLYA